MGRKHKKSKYSKRKAESDDDSGDESDDEPTYTPKSKKGAFDLQNMIKLILFLIALYCVVSSAAFVRAMSVVKGTVKADMPTETTMLGTSAQATLLGIIAAMGVKLIEMGRL